MYILESVRVFYVNNRRILTLLLCVCLAISGIILYSTMCGEHWCSSVTQPSSLPLSRSSHTLSSRVGSSDCQCNNTQLCAPLSASEAAGSDGRSQVITFVLPCNESVWRTFDWQRLTIIVLVNFYSPRLLCHAHQHGVRVFANSDFNVTNVTQPAYRSSWISRQMALLKVRYLDGLNVDFEQPVGEKEPARAAFVQLMNETRAALSNYNDASLLMVDVPWTCAKCVDDRCYDYTGLAQNADLLFVMGYDQRSQLAAGDCVAGANAPLDHILAGVRNYTSHCGVPANQLVLGMPWYGYDYTCINNVTVNGTCDIEHEPFRGSVCSDSVGTQRPYSQLEEWSRLAETQQHWSNSTQTPYMQLKMAGWKCTHQVWYDDMTSVTFKVMGAASLRLAGVGIWTANYLDWRHTKQAIQQRNNMWGTMMRWNMFDD